MKKITAVSGSGDIGIDPLNRSTWSGSSYRFFSECDRRGWLRNAIGVEVSPIVRAGIAARNFRRNRFEWRTRYYMDVWYRKALTRQLNGLLHKCRNEDEDIVIQLGSMFNAAEIVRSRCACWSYNDGNFAMAARSPHFPKKISSRLIDRTLAYEQEVTESLDHILTMSEYLRRSFIEDYGCPATKVTCIGCGINLDSMPTLCRDKQYDANRLLFIGVDFARKGGREILNAFRKVRTEFADAELHVVGPRMIPKPARDIQGIVWHGFLNKGIPQQMDKLDNLLRTSTLFVMPSRYEPFGIAPAEAMAYGIPCIVSRAWALPEIVKEGVTGELVAPGDADQLADRIISLFRSPDTLKKYGDAGRHRVEEEFSWKAVADRLEPLLVGK